MKATFGNTHIITKVKELLTADGVEINRSFPFARYLRSIMTEIVLDWRVANLEETPKGVSIELDDDLVAWGVCTEYYIFVGDFDMAMKYTKKMESKKNGGTRKYKS